jgi:hypothetical protein
MGRKTRVGTQMGACNVCRTHGPLTFDHVPPKGSVSVTSVEIESFGQWIRSLSNVRTTKPSSAASRGLKKSFSQNGMKFRSLCATCNNSRLGARYDVELNRVSQTVGGLAKAHFTLGLQLPMTLQVPVRTHSLMRAVVGHLLSAAPAPDSPLYKTDNFMKSVAEWNDSLREYFLDEELPLPPNVKVYYWPYPGTEQSVITGLITGQTGSNSGVVMGSLLKFFPVSYFVTFDAYGDIALPVPEVHGDGCVDLDCQINLRIDFRNTPAATWPEAPGGSGFAMMPTDAAKVARSRINRTPTV